MFTKFKMIYAVACFLPAIALAQSPIDGFMKAKGNGSVTLSYATESYDEVYLVPEKVDRVPVFGEVDKSVFSLYADYAISNDFMLVLNLPYITAEGQATQESQERNGFENERNGIQDLSIHGKYRFYTAELKSSTLDFMGALGIEFPLGDYAADEGLQSIIAIGNRSTRFNALGLATYKMNNGFFSTAQLGYSIRSNDVPNAVISELKLGYAGSGFYVDAYVANQLSSDSGVDILGDGFMGFFPATRVNYTRAGLNAYVPVSGGVGVSAGANTYLAGRNLGDATGFYGGLTYSF
ncbi:MAG: hypothetical protein WBG71_12765 [Leeuwenhoekiella sp.]